MAIQSRFGWSVKWNSTRGQIPATDYKILICFSQIYPWMSLGRFPWTFIFSKILQTYIIWYIWSFVIALGLLAFKMSKVFMQLLRQSVGRELKVSYSSFSYILHISLFKINFLDLRRKTPMGSIFYHGSVYFLSCLHSL